MPYTHTNRKGQTSSLHGKEVTLQNGRKQQIYYFAREPKTGEALDALPAGRAIVENPRTGLPFLKGTSSAAPGASAPSGSSTRATKSTAGAQRVPTRR